MDTEKLPAKKTRILVVDDEAGICKMLTYELTNRGYDVASAGDGLEAFRLVEMAPFNLIISDLKMPKMDGIEMLEAVKKINPAIEVIMTTGYASLELAIESIKKGAYDFITKPYNISELHTRIEKALEKQRMGHEIHSLKELNRMKSEFLANMSHELRTPINAIMGFAQLMEDKLYGELSDQQDYALKRINTNAVSLLALINNILDISKLAAGKMPLYLEEFNLRELLQEVSEMMEGLAEEKKIALTLEPMEKMEIVSDRTRVKQILINLIGNAIKFTQKGGIQLSAAIDAEDKWVRIAVVDTGIGIRPENIDAIFEEFRQGDASTTRKYGGTGLGLAIVKKLTDLLNGTVRVESVLNAGSTFTVSLPVKSKISAVHNPEADRSVLVKSIAAADKNIILAIDDDPEVLKLLKDGLAETNFTFLSALSGDEGIALAKQFHPMAITLDILMPHKDGWTVIQTLKNDPETAAIPIIILSVMENKALGFSLGVTDYITKPFDRKSLIEKLHSLSQARTKKVMVVDDDPGLNSSLQLLLKNEGYQVTSAADGAAALKLIAFDVPDLLILNLMMPEMDGFDVLESIQKNPAFNDMKVIVMSARELTPSESEKLNSRTALIVQKESQNLRDILQKVKKNILSAQEPRDHGL